MSEVNLKVTVTSKWYTTLHYSKMHPHTKFGIHISNNMRHVQDTIILKLGHRSKSKSPCMTPSHPKMHPHTKFGIPFLNNIRYMDKIILTSRYEVKVTVTRNCYTTLQHPKMHLHIWGTCIKRLFWPPPP